MGEGNVCCRVILVRLFFVNVVFLIIFFNGLVFILLVFVIFNEVKEVKKYINVY